MGWLWQSPPRDNVWAKAWSSVPGKERSARKRKDRCTGGRFLAMFSTGTVSEAGVEWERGRGGNDRRARSRGALPAVARPLVFARCAMAGPWAEKSPGLLWFRTQRKTAVCLWYSYFLLVSTTRDILAQVFIFSYLSPLAPTVSPQEALLNESVLLDTTGAI